MAFASDCATRVHARTPYGLDFLDGFTGSAFFGGEGLRIRSTFQVRITCGWRGLSIDTILP
jgi:hypothetical protein